MNKIRFIFENTSKIIKSFMGYWKIQVSVRYLQVLPGGLQDGSFFGKCVRISAVAGIYKRSWSVVLCYILCPDRDYCTVGS